MHLDGNSPREDFSHYNVCLQHFSVDNTWPQVVVNLENGFVDGIFPLEGVVSRTGRDLCPRDSRETLVRAEWMMVRNA